MAARILTKIGSFEEASLEGVVRVFHFKSTPADEASFGKLFALGESNNKKCEEALRMLEAALGEYYNPALRARLSAGRAVSMETLFEELLHEVNEEWTRSPVADQREIHVVVGLQKDNVMHLTSHGSLRALLFRERDGGHLQHFDLLRLKEGERAKEGGIFSHVISGELKPGDSVALLSKRFLETLTLREVEKALTLTTSGGVALLQDEVSKNKPSFTVGSLILRRIAEEEATVWMKPAVSPQGSLQNLQKTEISTEKVLSQQSFPGFKEFLASLTMRRRERRHSPVLIKKRRSPLTRFMRRLGIALAKILYAIFSSLAAIIKFLFTFLTNFHGGREKMVGEIKETGRGRLERSVASFNVLPKRSKTILFASLLLLFLFTQSAMLSARRNFSRERERTWKALADEISGTRDEIESNLLYGDDERAKILLGEAAAKINILAKDSRKHEEEIKKLRALLDGTAMRVRKIIIVDNPGTLATLGEAENFVALLTYGSGFIAGRNDGVLLEINRETKLTAPLPQPETKNNFTLFSGEDSSLLAVSFDIASLFSSGAWVTLGLERNNREGANDISLYGGKLYILDQAKDAIWKYNKTELGWNGESQWLKDPYELESITSMTIDNSLFMLDDSGRIRKFFRGREQEYNTAVLLPAFGAPSASMAGSEPAPVNIKPGKIRTTPGAQYLYVTDPSGKRLIVWKKNGELAAQYVSPKFDDIKDVAFDEKRKEIYLLNGNAIYSILAVHMDKK